jgi:hypothetical protein
MHQSEWQDQDPHQSHQSEKVEPLNGHFGAFEVPDMKKWVVGSGSGNAAPLFSLLQHFPSSLCF